MIRVLILSSSEVARTGLETLVRSAGNVELVGTRADDPDVIVTDREEIPPDWKPAVVLLTSDPAPAATFELLRSGARAVLPGDAGRSQILAAIEAAASGLIVMRPEDFEPWHGSHRPVELAEPLSGREAEVLGMLAEGLANKIIAHRLGISEHTVKFHVTSILAKLSAGSRTEAVTIGIRQGLVML